MLMLKAIQSLPVDDLALEPDFDFADEASSSIWAAMLTTLMQVSAHCEKTLIDFLGTTPGRAHLTQCDCAPGDRRDLTLVP